MLKKPSLSVCIVGIDPGRRGAIAALWPHDNLLKVWDLPIYVTPGSSRDFSYLDAKRLHTLVRWLQPQSAYLERVWALPSDGAVGAFSFGDNFGSCRSVLAVLDVPPVMVTPSVWKSAMKAPADKPLSTARAIHLMPNCEEDFTRSDRAEAAMIALYGALDLGFTVGSLNLNREIGPHAEERRTQRKSKSPPIQKVDTLLQV